MTAIFAVLFFSMFMTGCEEAKNDQSNLQKNLVILQAYGSSSTAAGASHSFVELYNKSGKAINLNGIGLYYADGTTVPSGTNTATEDGAWTRISLDGKTIPAKGSFLILGPKESTAARYQIPENSGDINNENFKLSNRAFKVALIKSTAGLTVQNPFDTDGSGKSVSGYIDMVGAANDYQGRDLIFGFETAPVRNSASEAVRRVDIEFDDDNNSEDFTAARYALSDGGMSDEELEARKPRNSSAGKWNPFEEPATLPPTEVGTPSALATKLLILQVYGTGTATDGAVSHSFIELYNNTDSPVNLNTYSLQYSNTTGTNWTVINLTGTIPAKGSYLVRGNKNNESGRLQLDAADQDVAFYLDNGNFKVALMANKNKLTVENPFAMTGGKAKDYVDMVGVKNGNSDNIDGYETALAQVISKQAAARRKNLTDSDNNSADFERIDYRITGVSNELLEVRRPRTSSGGNWDPFEAPAPPVTGEGSLLMIFQAGASTNGAITRNFVELYNNTDNAINLSTYSLQYGTTGAGWTKIDLTGTIPAKGSYLVMSNFGTVNAENRLLIEDEEADQVVQGFVLSNNGFKVALMSNQNTLSVINPFDTGSGEKAAGYVDLLGATNGTNPDAYETELPSIISKQAAARRDSLTDTDNNKTDFVRIDYRDPSVNASGITNEQLAKFRPRYSGDGAWTPQF